MNVRLYEASGLTTSTQGIDACRGTLVLAQGKRERGERRTDRAHPVPMADAERSGGASSLVPPGQLAGLRAVTIHAAASIITDRSPARPAKAARTAPKARARMSSG